MIEQEKISDVSRIVLSTPSIKTNDEPKNTNILENKVIYQLTGSFLDLAVLRQEF